VQTLLTAGGRSSGDGDNLPLRPDTVPVTTTVEAGSSPSGWFETIGGVSIEKSITTYFTVFLEKFQDK